MKIKIFLILILLVLLPVVEATVTIKPNVLFKLKTGAYLQFENRTNFNKIIVEIDKIYFDNYWFKLKDANITFKKFYENNTLVFDLTGSSGSTSEIEIYFPLNPSRLLINKVEQPKDTVWSYNSTTKTIRISYTFK
jgi:hypothetical protein